MKITYNINPYEIEKVKHIEFNDFLKMLSKEHINIKKHRAKLGDKEYEENPYFKKKLPKIIFDGLYTRREQVAYIENTSTGLFLIDFDDVNNFDRLKEILIGLSPLLIFQSVSKDLKVIFKTDVLDQTIYPIASRYLIKNLEEYLKDYKIVESIKYKIDYTAPCVGTFLSYDPNYYYNPDSNVLKLKDVSIKEKDKIEKEINEKKKRFDKLDISKEDNIKNIKNLIDYLEYNNYSMTENYDNWIEIGYALFNSFDDEIADQLFYRFSVMDENFKPRSYQSTVKSILKHKYNNTSHRKLTIGSIFYKAKIFYNYNKKNMEDLYYITFDTIKDEKPKIYKIDVTKETKTYLYIKEYSNINKKRIKKDDLDKIKLKKQSTNEYKLELFSYGYKRKENIIQIKTKLRELYMPLYEKISKFI